eukprot:6242701-Amphidinium_carterae.1
MSDNCSKTFEDRFPHKRVVLERRRQSSIRRRSMRLVSLSAVHILGVLHRTYAANLPHRFLHSLP